MPTDLPPAQYDLALRTFLDEFPHAQLWYFPPIGTFTMTNTFLIGSNEPLDIDPAWMQRAFESEPEAFQGIRKYGLTTAEAVIAHFVGTRETLRRVVPPGPVNTFDEPRYEFYSPGDYAVPPDQRTLINHELLLSVRGPDFDRYVRQGGSGPSHDRLTAAFHAEAVFLAGHRAQLQGRSAQEVMEYYDEAVTAAPWDRNLRNEVISYLNRESLNRYFGGDYAGATAFLRRAAELYPESSDIHYDYGWMLEKMNQTDLAVTELQQAVAMNPRLVPARRFLASLYALRGQGEPAAEQWKEALAIDPNDVPSLVGYGVFLAEQHPSAEAIEYLRRADRLDPGDPDVIDGYARVEYLNGNLSEARRIILKGGDYYKGNRDFEEFRAAVLSVS
jgi:Flp pilus assembly protein TadD